MGSVFHHIASETKALKRSKGRCRNRNTGKKESEKTEEVWEYTPSQRSVHIPIATESNIKDESNTEGAEHVLLEKEEPADQQDLIEEDSYNLRSTVTCYILNCIWAFICLFVAIHIAIRLTTDEGFPSLHFDETTWTIGIVLCIIFVSTVASALLALIELPDFLEYIFKCASIINFVIIAAFTTNIFLKSNSFLITSDELYVKIATWICTIWVTSIITIGIALLIIKDLLNLKTQVHTFFDFITKFAFTFYAVLIVLKNIIRSNNNNLYGVEFDEIFWKFVNSLCYMLIAVLGICCALFFQVIKW